LLRIAGGLIKPNSGEVGGEGLTLGAPKLIQIIDLRRTWSDDNIATGMGGRQMPSYRVCFMNEIPRNDRLFRCCQRSILIRSAPNIEGALEAAKQEFAELEGIRDWKIHATRIEIEPVDLKTEPENLPHKRTEISAASDKACFPSI